MFARTITTFLRSWGMRLLECIQRVLLLTAFFFPMSLSAIAGDAAALGSFVADLDHPEAERRFAAVEELGASGDPRAVAPLIKALQQDIQQRSGILMVIIPALGQLGDERAVPILIESLNRREEDWLAREAAARALGEIGAAQAVPALVDAAWMADTRAAAIGALATIGDAQATDVLLSAFGPAEEAGVQEQAVAGLIRIGAPAVPALIEKLEVRSKEYPADHERSLAARALGETGDARALNPLTAALSDPSPEVRRSARAAKDRLHLKN